MRGLIACSALFTLTACASGGWVEVPIYRHYYFYEPRLAVAPASAINARQDVSTIDLAFPGSENTVSVSTMPTRGDLGFIMGRSGNETDYTGVLALDALNAATRSSGSIPMRLWVAASCQDQSWVILPSRVRLIDRTKNSADIPLTEYLQPLPAVLHADSRVFTGHWRYTQLDSNKEISCRKGSAVAFTAGFEITLTLTSLRIVFEDSIQLDGKVLRFPDIELSLTEGKIYKSTKWISIPEVIVRSLGSLAR